MPNQDQRPAALGTGVPHDGVEVVQEGAEIWRVPTLAAAAAVAAVVHAIDGRAQWRKPLRQVSVAAAMLPQPVHDDERPLVRYGGRLPTAHEQMEAVRRFQRVGRLVHGLSWRKPR